MKCPKVIPRESDTGSDTHVCSKHSRSTSPISHGIAVLPIHSTNQLCWKRLPSTWTASEHHAIHHDRIWERWMAPTPKRHKARQRGMSTSLQNFMSAVSTEERKYPDRFWPERAHLHAGRTPEDPAPLAYAHDLPLIYVVRGGIPLLGRVHAHLLGNLTLKNDSIVKKRVQYSRLHWPWACWRYGNKSLHCIASSTYWTWPRMKLAWSNSISKGNSRSLPTFDGGVGDSRLHTVGLHTRWRWRDVGHDLFSIESVLLRINSFNCLNIV